MSLLLFLIFLIKSKTKAVKANPQAIGIIFSPCINIFSTISLNAKAKTEVVKKAIAKFLTNTKFLFFTISMISFQKKHITAMAVPTCKTKFIKTRFSLI